MRIKTHRFSDTLALVGPAAVLVASHASTSGAGYLKIDGIAGESKASGYEEQIEILSWSWGVTHPGRAGGGGGGKASFQDLSIVKHVDKSSPKLFLACATGESVPELTLTITRRSPDGGDAAYYTITLHDVLVSSLKSDRPVLTEIQTRELPMEEISLNYGKITWTYTPMDPATGKLGEPVSVSARVETEPVH